MTENSFRVPLIIAVIIRGINLLMTIGCVQAQDMIISLYISGRISQKVMPTVEIMSQLVVLAVYLIFCLVVFQYKGESRRLMAGIFIAGICLLSMGELGLSRFSSIVNARTRGAEYLAAYSALTSAISMINHPGTIVSSALFFVGAGRYGVSTRKMEDFD